jgi:hypothetical protein
MGKMELLGFLRLRSSASGGLKDVLTAKSLFAYLLSFSPMC